MSAGPRPGAPPRRGRGAGSRRGPRPRRPAAGPAGRTTRWRRRPTPRRRRAARRDATSSGPARSTAPGRSRTARTRRPPGRRRATVVPASTRNDFSPGRAQHRTRRRRGRPSPAPSGPGRTAARSTPAPAPAAAAGPATAASTSSSRARSDATRSSAAASVPVALPSVPTEASTSSRVCGSMVSTSAVQPRWASASSTTRDVDRADRAQVLGDDEVGVEAGQRALVEVVEVLAARASRSATKASISAGRQALGHRAGRDDAPASRASAGWSHSKVTPTTSSPAPRSNRISVVDGRRETMRIGPGYRARCRTARPR